MNENKYTENNPAQNSCVNCKHELTCGYSHLAMLETRTEFSYMPCVLGMMACGKPFFEHK